MALFRKSKKKEVTTSKTTEKAARASDYAIILSPVITEKTAVIGNDGNTVVFSVDPRADKLEIKAAIEKIFNVNVSSVRTARYIGKMKRSAKGSGRKPQQKRAIVTLRAGQTIDVVEGM